MRRIGLGHGRASSRTCVLTGAAVLAVHDVCSGRAALPAMPETHHAHHDFGSSYCVFNDIAVAAGAALQDTISRSRSLISTFIRATGQPPSFKPTPACSRSQSTVSKTSRSVSRAVVTSMWGWRRAQGTLISPNNR